MLRAALPATTCLRIQHFTRCQGMAVSASIQAAQPSTSASLSVAIIGAGAAGMVAARELRREGHCPTVFEQGDQIGGVWVYTDEIEAEDPLGVSENRRRVHGSMYRSLRTNLPRHVMAFTDFPFDFNATGSDDNRLYCGHQEVLRYLKLFDKAFGLSQMTQFNTKVLEARPVDDSDSASSAKRNLDCQESHRDASVGPRWRLTLSHRGSETDQDFDALVVCNGHYSDPRVPDLPGCSEFPGQVLHTHNFRENGPFEGLRVVIMGASASGQDIAREIADVANTVYFSARPMRFGSKQIDWASSDDAFGRKHNMFRRAAIQSLEEDGSVTFQNGWRVENIDVVVFATGYKFSFPFLESSAVVNVSDNRVSPLYQHAICTAHPSLSFIGLPWQVIPFPLMELQSKWVAKILSGKAALPSRQAMELHTENFHKEREAAGVPVRYTHRLGEDQWEYNAWLAEQIGPDQSQLPAWRPRMHKAGQTNIRERPDSYRDTWLDDAVLDEGERQASELRTSSPAVAAVA